MRPLDCFLPDSGGTPAYDVDQRFWYLDESAEVVGVTRQKPGRVLLKGFHFTEQQLEIGAAAMLYLAGGVRLVRNLKSSEVWEDALERFGEEEMEPADILRHEDHPLIPEDVLIVVSHPECVGRVHTFPDKRRGLVLYNMSAVRAYQVERVTRFTMVA